MEELYTVPLKKIIDEFQLQIIYMPEDDNILVSRSDVNRPGLALTGFFGHFEPGRIQIIGKGEHEFLTNLSDEEREERINVFMSKHPVAVVFTSELRIFDELLEAARQYAIPVLMTNCSSQLMECNCNWSLIHASTSTMAMPLKTELARVRIRSFSP